MARVRWLNLRSISTHAPAGGATPSVSCVPFTLIVFLLTPLREGRRGTAAQDAHFGQISTHAPAGGATVRRSWLLLQRQHFYSRPCGRGDAMIV